jgi:hypothetical protein
MRALLSVSARAAGKTFQQLDPKARVIGSR